MGTDGDDCESRSQAEQNREELFKLIDQMREAFKDVPVEEIEREADRAVAELRNKAPKTA